MNWKKIVKESINQILSPEIKWIHIGYNRFNGRSTPIENDKLKSANLIIGYNKDTDLYIAWNALLHQKDNYHTQTLAINKKYIYKNENNPHFVMDNNLAFSVYRGIQGKSHFYEKILIMKPEFVYEFCKAPFDYLLPNPSDPEYRENTLYSHPIDGKITLWHNSTCVKYTSKSYREYYSCKRVNRDTQFRQNIFSKYTIPHCIICGINIKTILEAAHIIAVKDGGSDHPQNGICLCRNHHKLYDEKLLFIDLQKSSFYIKDSEIAKKLGLKINYPYPLNCNRELKMLDMFDDNDDIQNVWHNWEMPEE